MLTAKLKAVAEEGIGGLAGHGSGAALRGQKKKRVSERKIPGLADILLSVASEQLPHPHRTAWCIRWSSWRQADIRRYGLFSGAEALMVRCYGAFVIFRCPMTDTLREFATMAKQMNSLYDVDDLVIDTKYTDQIPFLDRMQPEETAGIRSECPKHGRAAFPLRCGGYDDSGAGRRTEAVRTGGADQPQLCVR